MEAALFTYIFLFIVIQQSKGFDIMHKAARRSSSVSEFPGTPGIDAASPLVGYSTSHGSKGKTEQRKQNRIKETLRRCKSTPEKKPATQSTADTNPDTWKCVWDKERGYVTDLIAEQRPTTNQPQLSYFAYLGNHHPGKGRYQAVSNDAEVVINLGNSIVARNCSSANANSEEKESSEFQGNAAHISEPIKTDTTQFVECCSCMCCVKAIFYHCTKDGEFERDWANEPCACEVPGNECVARWSILGMLSLFMPCLMCYPVIKICCKSPLNSLRKWKS